MKAATIELCLTPTCASWANPVAARFGPLRTFVTGNSEANGNNAGDAHEPEPRDQTPASVRD